MARVVHIALPASTDHRMPIAGALPVSFDAGSHAGPVERRESAMYETNVTVVGRLATDVDWQPTRRRHRSSPTSASPARSVATIGRPAAGSMARSLFIDVRCWRRLAENAAASLVKGDPVVVTGKLYSRNYEHEGQRRTAVTVEAQNVAADLSRCTVVLKRDRPAGHRGRGHGRSDSRTRRTTPTAPARPGGRRTGRRGLMVAQLPSTTWRSSSTPCRRSGRPTVTRSSSMT